MPNINHDLFDLIKSLNVKEYNSIKRNAFPYSKRGKNRLVLLFELIYHQTEFDEKALKQKIKNLASRKQELWKKIMLHLQANEESIQIIKARRKLDFVHILGNRGLYAQSYALMNEVKEWSITYNQVFYHAITLQYESGFVQGYYNENFETKINELSRETLSVANQIYITAKVYDFYLRVTEVEYQCHIQRNDAMKNNISKFLDDPCYNLDTKEMSFQSLLTFLNAKSAIHFNRFEFEIAYKIELLADKAYAILTNKTMPDIYNRRCWLSHAMTLHDRIKDFPLWEKHILEFEEITNKYYSDDLMTKSIMLHQKLWFYHRTNYFQSTPQKLAEIEKFYIQNKQNISEYNKIYFEWNLALSYFNLGEYVSAWRYSYNIVHFSAKNIMNDVKDFFKLFLLFVQFELKEFQVIDTGTKHYLKEKKTLINNNDYAFDLRTIQFFRSLLKALPLNKKNILSICSEYKKDILQLQTNNHIHTNEFLFQFNVLDWLDSLTKKQNP